jgi:hypothetical protein
MKREGTRAFPGREETGDTLVGSEKADRHVGAFKFGVFDAVARGSGGGNYSI